MPTVSIGRGIRINVPAAPWNAADRAAWYWPKLATTGPAISRCVQQIAAKLRQRLVDETDPARVKQIIKDVLESAMLSIAPNSILRPAPTDAQGELRERTALLRKTAKRKLVTALERRNAVAEIDGLPGMEESTHIICRGNFPLWSIVPAVLTLAKPATITGLSIATLGFSKSNVGSLLELIDAGQIHDVSIVASVFFERQNPAEYQMMAEGLKERGQRIVALRSHAKVITIALSDGRRFTVESSANLRSCRNLEQITLTQSPALHDFHAGWIRDVITAAGSKAPQRKGKGKKRHGR